MNEIEWLIFIIVGAPVFALVLGFIVYGVMCLIMYLTPEVIEDWSAFRFRCRLAKLLEYAKYEPTHTDSGERQQVIDEVLGVIDKFNHNGSISVKLLKKELKALKGEENGTCK